MTQTNKLYHRNLVGQLTKLAETASSSIAPPLDISVAEFVQKTVVLSSRVSRRPGLIALDPYQIEPLNAIKNSEHVVCIWGTQVGKTILLQCAMAWAIEQYPGPMMIVCPDRSFCHRRSKKHLQPIIEDSPGLKKHMTDDKNDFQLFQYTLDTMDIVIAWAGSPSQMAGEPVMLLLRDEFDKYPDATEKESNAYALSERRTGSYDSMRRIFDATTPTTEDADGWKAYMSGTREEFYVPCPHCAESEKSHFDGERQQGWQTLRIEQFRFPERNKSGDDYEELCDWQARIEKNTHYECVDCGKAITESQRWTMVGQGQWFADNPEASKRSFHLPGWYSRSGYNSFGKTAARYVEGKENEQAKQDFMNSDAARPYSRAAENAHLQLVRAHRADYAAGTIPINEPVIIVMTADLHKMKHFYTIWALTYSRSYLLLADTTDSLTDLQKMRKEWTATNSNGGVYSISAAFIDAGYRPEDVYNMNIEDNFIIPCTGSKRSGEIGWTSVNTYPNTEKKLSRPVEILNINDVYWKEQLLLQLESGIPLDDDGKRIEGGELDLEDSSMWFYQDTPGEFCRHLINEQVETQRNTANQETRVWKKVGPNHYLDCTKIMLSARLSLRDNLKRLNQPVQPQQQQQPAVYGQRPDGY